MCDLQSKYFGADQIICFNFEKIDLLNSGTVTTFVVFVLNLTRHNIYSLLNRSMRYRFSVRYRFSKTIYQFSRTDFTSLVKKHCLWQRYRACNFYSIFYQLRTIRAQNSCGKKSILLLRRNLISL